MRLLDVSTMQLKEFVDDEIPPYAILSHTWGDGEVSINDLAAPYVDQKPGFQKIRYICTQAQRDGIQFAWCDTCCIDKSSSAELSESINSMFRYYANAHFCYAYLVDVTTKMPGPFEQQFAKSRWFQRGWTLQELIAPERVIFFAKGWVELGGKDNLEDKIVRITGVPGSVLCWPWTVQSYSIARRMSWASNRTTTRIEDEAYSLFGILEVNMPLVYGEGRNAFRRLQEELIKRSHDESIFSHSGPNILADRPAAFKDSKHIVPLKHAELHQPFSMTSRGVYIELRLVHGKNENTTDKNLPLYGVLNCHYKGDYDNYYAIPLQCIDRPDTFVRSSGPPLRIPEVEALRSERRKIYIELREPRRVTVSCILQCDFARKHGYVFNFGQSANNYGTTFAVDGQIMTLYLNPRSLSRWACMRFSFDHFRPEQEFDGLVFFDLACDKIGVWIQQRSVPLDRWTKGEYDSKFEGWKAEGSPQAYSTDLEIETDSYRQKVKVEAEIRLEERLKEKVWILDVSRSTPGKKRRIISSDVSCGILLRNLWNHN